MSIVTAWKAFVLCTAKQWKESYEEMMSFTKPMLLVRYEDLKTDLNSQLYRLADFLEVPVTAETVQRVIKDSQGQFLRPPPAYNYIDQYDNQMQTLLNQSLFYIEKMLFAKFDEKGYFLLNTSVSPAF